MKSSMKKPLKRNKLINGLVRLSQNLFIKKIKSMIR